MHLLVGADIGILQLPLAVMPRTSHSPLRTASLRAPHLLPLPTTKAKFRAATQDNFIFAKLSPYMKLQIVEESRSQGHIVSFLGDGVNDTMALQGVDVGISVDSGMEVAKDDAADVILLEKSLGMIADGVVLGRRM
jgi:P-type Mg2+ transporter